VSAAKLIGLMSLGIKQGDEVTVRVEGADEDKAFEELKTFMKDTL